MKKRKKFRDNFSIINNRLLKSSFTIPFVYDRFIFDPFSWFDIIKNNFITNSFPNYDSRLLFSNTTFKIDFDNIVVSKKKTEAYKSLSIQIFPTDYQKQILGNWFESYRLMLNETIKLYKKCIYNKEKFNTSFKHNRTYVLKDIKKQIYDKSLTSNKKTSIYSHSLDYAIKDICTNIKSAITNKKNRFIKNFRIRYIKKDKKTKRVKIEKTAFKIKDKMLYNSILGTINAKVDIPKITSDCTIMFRNNRYFLLIPQKTECGQNKSKNKSKNKTIALDGGIRTFMTGYSNSETIEICNNLQSKLIPIYETIDKIQSKYDNKEIKNKKGIQKRQIKIRNVIDELHWKTANYLVKNYDNILLGNISTKSIVSNDKSNIGTLNKRVALSMRLFEFKQRLKYKCEINKKTMVLINEAYTSKICSSCGNQNRIKNKSKDYECEKCGIKIDRDYNGAKNIYIIGTEY
jgi:putative transposase